MEVSLITGGCSNVGITYTWRSVPVQPTSVAVALVEMLLKKRYRDDTYTRRFYVIVLFIPEVRGPYSGFGSWVVGVLLVVSDHIHG